MSTEVSIQYLGDVQFEVKARKHTVFCDQPAENGGSDEGMTPPELLLASLGTCAGYYAVEYLRGHHLPARDLSVRVSAEKDKSPSRLSYFRIELHYPEELDARHRDGIFRAVHACLIHNTLLNSPQIEVEVMAPVLV